MASELADILRHRINVRHVHIKRNRSVQ
uniref:IstB_IS21 domain-containing protein n=1 Tax=Heterorhabditis bacteriophora TaxID=37862 RepID=A0A1I7WMA4_HETBA